MRTWSVNMVRVLPVDGSHVRMLPMALNSDTSYPVLNRLPKSLRLARRPFRRPVNCPVENQCSSTVPSSRHVRPSFTDNQSIDETLPTCISTFAYAIGWNNVVTAVPNTHCPKWAMNSNFSQYSSSIIIFLLFTKNHNIEYITPLVGR